LFKASDFDGWTAITASWGHGQAYTARFQALDLAEMYRISTDPDVREALSGYGIASYPQIPITHMVVDGEVKRFVSPKEIERYIKGKNARPEATDDQGASIAPIQEPKEEPLPLIQEPAPAVTQRVDWSGEWRIGSYTGSFLEEHRNRLEQLEPKKFGVSREVCVPTKRGLVFLLKGTTLFNVEIIENGKVVKTLKSNPEGRVLFGLKHRPNTKLEVRVSDESGASSTIQVVQAGDEER
jgi:hypothetical protein